MRRSQRHNLDAEAAVLRLRQRHAKESCMSLSDTRASSTSVEWSEVIEDDEATAITASPSSLALTSRSSASSTEKLPQRSLKLTAASSDPATSRADLLPDASMRVTSMSSVSEILAGFERFDRGPAIVGILSCSSAPSEDVLTGDLKAVAALQPHFFAAAHYENDKFYWCHHADFHPSINIKKVELNSGDRSEEAALNAYISPMLVDGSLVFIQDGESRPPWRIYLVSYTHHPNVHHIVLLLSHALGDGIDLITALLSVGVGEERIQPDNQELPDQLLLTPPISSATKSNDTVPSLMVLPPVTGTSPLSTTINNKRLQSTRSLLPLSILISYLSTHISLGISPRHIFVSSFLRFCGAVCFLYFVIKKCVLWIPKYFYDFHFRDAQVSLVAMEGTPEERASRSSTSLFNVSLPGFLDATVSPRHALPPKGFQRSFAKFDVPFAPIKEACRQRGVTVHDALQMAAGGAVGRYLNAPNNVRGCIAFSLRRNNGKRTTTADSLPSHTTPPTANDQTSQSLTATAAQEAPLQERSTGKNNANDFSFVVVPLETDVNGKNREKRLRATRKVMSDLKRSPEPMLMAMVTRLIRFLLPLPLFCKWVSWGMGHSCVVLSSLKGPTKAVFLGGSQITRLCNFFMPMRSKLSVSFLTYREHLSICVCGDEMVDSERRKKSLQGLVQHIAEELIAFGKGR